MGGMGGFTFNAPMIASRRCNGKSGYISAGIITMETRINKLLNTQD